MVGHFGQMAHMPPWKYLKFLGGLQGQFKIVQAKVVEICRAEEMAEDGLTRR